MSLARDLIVAALSVLGTLGAVRYTPLGGTRTTTGRAKSRGDNAFVLMVGLTFRDRASADTLLKAWHEAADYCMTNEPFLCAPRAAAKGDLLSYMCRLPAAVTPLDCCFQVSVRDCPIRQGAAQLRHLRTVPLEAGLCWTAPALAGIREVPA